MVSFVPEQGTSVWRVAALGSAVILLFASRACYNLTVLFLSQSHQVESFDFDWYNVSDQVITSPTVLLLMWYLGQRTLCWCKLLFWVLGLVERFE